MKREDLDVVIIGGGVIGLELAWACGKWRERLVVEKGEPWREATYAAAGMIAHCDPALRRVAGKVRPAPAFIRNSSGTARRGIQSPICAMPEPSFFWG